MDAMPKSILRIIVLSCFVLLACVIAGMPHASYAVEYGDYNGDGNITLEQAQNSSDIQPTHYKELGLEISPDIPEGSVAPIPEGKAVDIITNREAYVAVNGAHYNVYTVRDHLETLGPSARIDKKDITYNNDGSLYGAYKWYDVNDDPLDSQHGGSIGSYLSWNTDSVLKKAHAEYTGKYATSVAFSTAKGGDARDDHVAELRAYDRGWKQKWRENGEYYTGLIEIDVFSIAEDGTRTLESELLPTLHESQIIKTDGYHELRYVDFGYQQEYDAYFELEAADVDGDGIDELFAYTGAYEDIDGNRNAIVYMFKSSDGHKWDYSFVYVNTGAASNYVTLEELKAKNPDPWNHKGANYWRWQMARLAPVVTISAGDLDRNGTQEVAITTSAPTGHKKAADAATCRVFHWNTDEKNVVTVNGLDNIALSLEGKAMVSANTTFGSFALPTSLSYTYMVNAFVVAGWQTNDETAGPDGAWKSFAYRYVYYDPEDAAYKVADYTAHELGKNAKTIAQSAARKTGGAKRYMPVVAPFALGSAHLERLGDGVKSDHVLAGGEVYQFNLSTGLAVKAIGSMSLYTDQYHRMAHNKVYMDVKPKDHIWIGDVVSGYVADDGLVHDSFLAVIGVRRDDDVRGSDDYYWMDIGHFTFDQGTNGKVTTGQEGVVVESLRMGKSGGTYLSLCLPDIDNDSVRMRLVGKTVLPTAPQILAILQDTPYFADLQETYRYLSASATSFGKSSEQTVSNGFSLNVAEGGHLCATWDTGPAAQLDIAIKGSLGYDWQVSNAQGRSFTYSAQGGKGDKVVAYAVPMFYYRYEVFNPKTQKWDEFIQTLAGDPTISVLSVNAWNEVAKDTKSLAIIDNLVIASVGGKPETYTGSPDTTGTGLAGVPVGDSGQTSTVTSKSGEGGTVSQQISQSHSKSHNINPALQINVTTGFGVGLFGNGVSVGPVIDFAAGYEHSEVDLSSTEFSGTVDNLPVLTGVAGASGRYAFSWKLKANKIQYSEEDKQKYRSEHARKLDDVYLVGYDVTAFEQPDIAMVSDARVDSVASDNVVISWLPVDFGEDESGVACVYRVGMLAANGSGEVASWYTIDASPHPADQKQRVQYTVEGLDNSKKYEFVVVAAKGTRTGSSFTPQKASIPTPVLAAQTLEQGESLAILAQPEELPLLNPGDTAHYQVQAQWMRASGDNSNNISYLWQKWDASNSVWVELGDGIGDSIITVVPSTSDNQSLTTQGVNAFAGTAIGKAGSGAHSANLAGSAHDAPASDIAVNNAMQIAAKVEGGKASGDETALAAASLIFGSDALSIQGAASSTSALEVQGVTKELDGTVLRCNVGFGQQVISSSAAVMRIESGNENIVSAGPVGLAEVETSVANPLWFKQAQDGISDKARNEENAPDDDPAPAPTPKPDDKASPTPAPNNATPQNTTGKGTTTKTGDQTGATAMIAVLIACASAAVALRAYRRANVCHKTKWD